MTAPPDRPEAEAPPRRLIQALHLARQLGVSLLTRPISFGNLSYVQESVRGFEGIHLAAREIPLPPASAWEPLRRALLASLEAVIARCAVEEVRRLVDLLDRSGYREHQGPILARMRRWPRWGVMAEKAYRRLVFVVGPGIGVGDEIAALPMFDALRRRFAGATARAFTSYPGVWRSLLPDVPCEGQVERPLASYDHIEGLIRSGQSQGLLVVQATFSGLDMLQSYAGDRHGADFLEIAVGRGYLWWLPAEGVGHFDHTVQHPTVPHIGRGLEEATHFLLNPHDPRSPEARARRARLTFSQPPQPPRGPRDRALRLVINPFTSKDIRLSPEAWAGWLLHLRRRLPADRPLLCGLYYGLTDACRDYSRAIEARCQDEPHPGALSFTPITGRGGALLPAPDAVPLCHAFIAKADLVIGMDTFTAHLAAFSPAVSIALCLTRNRLFWQASPRTLWVDMRVGDDTLRALFDVVMEALLRPLAAQPAARAVYDACREIAGAGRPEWLLWAPDGRARLDALRARLQGVWAGLPPQAQALLFRLDTDFAWPLLNQELEYVDASPSELEASCLKLASTTFYRLICLQAGLGAGA